MYSFNSASAGIMFSPKAARKVVELVSAGGRRAPMLRVYIQGGGCSGFQYGFSFEDAPAEDDLTIANDGATLLVDPLSYQYLMGSEVDYREDLEGARFVINNPNAVTTCGCGASFSI